MTCHWFCANSRVLWGSSQLLVGQRWWVLANFTWSWIKNFAGFDFTPETKQNSARYVHTLMLTSLSRFRSHSFKFVLFSVYSLNLFLLLQFFDFNKWKNFALTTFIICFTMFPQSLAFICCANVSNFVTLSIWFYFVFHIIDSEKHGKFSASAINNVASIWSPFFLSLFAAVISNFLIWIISEWRLSVGRPMMAIDIRPQRPYCRVSFMRRCVDNIHVWCACRTIHLSFSVLLCLLLLSFDLISAHRLLLFANAVAILQSNGTSIATNTHTYTHTDTLKIDP